MGAILALLKAFVAWMTGARLFANALSIVIRAVNLRDRHCSFWYSLSNSLIAKCFSNAITSDLKSWFGYFVRSSCAALCCSFAWHVCRAQLCAVALRGMCFALRDGFARCVFLLRAVALCGTLFTLFSQYFVMVMACVTEWPTS